MARNELQGQPATECPHIHFKTNVIDRDILTKRQHLNLLCTPKGYRWEVAFIREDEQQLECSSKTNGKPRRSYVYNLLADLWSVVTPEMVTTLQEMMVKEFGLNKEEAREFVCKQMKEMIPATRKRSKNAAETSPEDLPYPLFISKDVEHSEQLRCRSNMSINVKPSVVKNITNALAGKLAEVAMFMMQGKKGHKQRRMSEVLFNGLCQISGETFNPKEPKNKLHKLQVFVADKLAMWLAENIVDEKLVQARNRRKEDAVIQKNAHKRAKDYDMNLRRRAALARRIEIQKQVAEEREKEAKRKEDEAKKLLEETRKKQMEEWKKRDEENKKQAKALRLKAKAEKKDKEKKKEDAKAKQGVVGLVGDITTNAEKKNNDSMKMKKDHRKARTGTLAKSGVKTNYKKTKKK